MQKNTISLYLFSFFMIMPIHAVFPVLPLIREDIHASYAQISLFLASMGIVRLLLAVPSGILADRFSHRPLLMMSGAMAVGGLLLMSRADSFWVLLASRLLAGSASIVCNITVLVALAQASPPGSRGKIMSMNNVIHSAGAIVTPALTGVIAGLYGWRLPFLMLAGLILGAIAIAAVGLEAAAPGRRPCGLEPRPQSPPDAIRRSGLFRSLLPVFFVGFFVFFYRSAFRHTLIPFYGKDILGLTVESLGFYISLTAAIAMASLLGFGAVADRFGRKAALAPGVAFSGLAVAALLLPDGCHPMLWASILVGLGAVINSMPNVLITDLVVRKDYGKGMGLNRTFADGGYFLGTLLTGALMDRFGFAIPVYALAAYCGVVLLVVMAMTPNRPADYVPNSPRNR